MRNRVRDIMVSRDQASTPTMADSEAALECCELRDCLDVGEPIILGQGQREIDHIIVDQMDDVGVSQDTIGPESANGPASEPSVSQRWRLDQSVVGRIEAAGAAEHLDLKTSPLQSIEPGTEGPVGVIAIESAGQDQNSDAAAALNSSHVSPRAALP
jgi:hypothetical protein